MKIAICDDEQGEILKIEDAILQINANSEIYCFQSGSSLIAEIAKQRDFNLIFIDIYLNGENGIDVAREIKNILPDVDIVFTTVSRDHAVEAFSIRALHYIVKPFNDADIIEVFKRIGKKRETRSTLTLRIERSINVLFQDEILKVESQGHRTIITMVDKTVFSIRKPFSEITLLLDETFIHLKKGVCVNMQYVSQMKTIDCTLIDGTRYLLRREKKAEIRERYNNFIMEKMNKQY